MLKKLEKAVLIDVVDKGMMNEVTILVESPTEIYRASKSGYRTDDWVEYDYNTHRLPRKVYEDEVGRYIDFTDSDWSHLGKIYLEEYLNIKGEK